MRVACAFDLRSQNARRLQQQQQQYQPQQTQTAAEFAAEFVRISARYPDWTGAGTHIIKVQYRRHAHARLSHKEISGKRGAAFDTVIAIGRDGCARNLAKLCCVHSNHNHTKRQKCSYTNDDVVWWTSRVIVSCVYVVLSAIASFGSWCLCTKRI